MNALNNKIKNLIPNFNISHTTNIVQLYLVNIESQSQSNEHRTKKTFL